MGRAFSRGGRGGGTGGEVGGEIIRAFEELLHAHCGAIGEVVEGGQALGGEESVVGGRVAGAAEILEAFVLSVDEGLDEFEGGGFLRRRVVEHRGEHDGWFAVSESGVEVAVM